MGGIKSAREESSRANREFEAVQAKYEPLWRKLLSGGTSGLVAQHAKDNVLSIANANRDIDAADSIARRKRFLFEDTQEDRKAIGRGTIRRVVAGPRANYRLIRKKFSPTKSRKN